MNSSNSHSSDNVDKKPQSIIVEGIHKTMLQSLNQTKKDDPKNEQDFILFIKDTIQSVLKLPEYDKEKRKIINLVENKINEDIGKKSEQFENFIEEEYEIANLRTIQPSKQAIIDWHIQEPSDIISLISTQDKLINNIQNIIHTKGGEEQSILERILEPITQEHLHIESDNNTYEYLITQEIKKELEYIIINKLLNFTKHNLQHKRDWCRNALYYIQHEFLYGQNIEPIKNIDSEWMKYYGPLIEEFLQEKDSSQTRDSVFINKDNKYAEQTDFLPKEHLKLFEKRCKSVLHENHRQEHKIGKDMIRELGERKIDLKNQ